MDHISFTDALDAAGRSGFCGYHASDYTISDIKCAERRRVADFILKNVKDDFVWLLSMPGADWYFERLLQSMTDKPVQIVGLENNYAVYAQACRSMPEGKNFASAPSTSMRAQHREMFLGSARYNYCRTGFIRNKKGAGRRDIRSHRLLMMDVETYTSIALSDIGASMDEKRRFADKFMHRTAAWLDFTGTLSSRTLSAIANLHFCMMADGREKPVVITVAGCRDAFNSTSARIDAIKSAQPAINIVDAWTYVGKGNVSMLTVCGLII